MQYVTEGHHKGFGTHFQCRECFCVWQGVAGSTMTPDSLPLYVKVALWLNYDCVLKD